MSVRHTESSVLSSYVGELHINSSGLSSNVGATHRQFSVEFIWWRGTYKQFMVCSNVGAKYRQFSVEFIWWPSTYKQFRVELICRCYIQTVHG
jgi:hypothetical protein